MTDAFSRLDATVAARIAAEPGSSYIASLAAKGVAHAAKKLGEEAVETVIAALGDDSSALTGEAADLVFHLAVLLRLKGLDLGAVAAELARREGVSGLAEKAARAQE